MATKARDICVKISMLAKCDKFQILPTLRPVLTLILSKKLKRLYFPSLNKIYLKYQDFKESALLKLLII